MASGNLSPRQKMINLMYLIFIAMLALNMSKEVLSAFGLMNEKLTESNQAASERNTAFIDNLEQKAIDQNEKYEPLKLKASQIKDLATNFNTYLQELKSNMSATVDDATDYEIMDKGDYLDQNFSQVTPNQYLSNNCPLSAIEHSVEAIVPESNIKASLALSDNEPCLLLNRRTWSGDKLVSSALLYHPGSKYKLTSKIELN